jgi:hypothetical protein
LRSIIHTPSACNLRQNYKSCRCKKRPGLGELERIGTSITTLTPCLSAPINRCPSKRATANIKKKTISRVCSQILASTFLVTRDRCEPGARFHQCKIGTTIDSVVRSWRPWRYTLWIDVRHALDVVLPIFVSLKDGLHCQVFVCLSPTRHIKVCAAFERLHLSKRRSLTGKHDTTTLGCHHQPVTWFAGPKSWQSDSTATHPIPCTMRSLECMCYTVSVPVSLLTIHYFTSGALSWTPTIL